MTSRRFRSIGPVVAWFVFPVVPALLEQLYYGFFNFGGADPRVWDAQHWLLITGPLLGYGFLAGVTAGIPDVPGRRWGKALVTSRAGWVAVGPWIGFVVWAILLFVLEHTSLPQPNAPDWLAAPIFWTIPYYWLILAWAAARRARRVGQLWRSLRRGLLTAFAFLGSLFGSFWAATEIWRSYFFDPAIARTILIAALCLTALSGCGTATVGEIRRRELFTAMLTAWVLGLAIAWRWWGRPRGR